MKNAKLRSAQNSLNTFASYKPSSSGVSLGSQALAYQNEELQNYFLEQSWYTPNPDLPAGSFDIGQFTELERANLETILRYGRDRGWKYYFSHGIFPCRWERVVVE